MVAGDEARDREGARAHAGEARTLGSAALKFAVGDRVRVRVGPNAGRVGRICDQNVGRSCKVQLDGELAGAWWPCEALDIVPVAPFDGGGTGEAARAIRAHLSPCPNVGRPGPCDCYACAPSRRRSPLERAAAESARKRAFHGDADRSSSPARGAPAAGIGSPTVYAPTAERVSFALDLGPRERETVPELSDADDGEERALLHLGREQLLALARTRTEERDAARASVDALTDQLDELELGDAERGARLREAVGLLTDVNLCAGRVAAFLDREVQR